YGKCFMSLRRSSMFREMEIIIVDDGSTDEETVMIIKRLARMYSNITVYTYDDGGSGSASRPRNKGIELATTDYITYLDPDNEAVNDGYAKLYKEMTEGAFDLVIGNMLKVAREDKLFDYCNEINAIMGKTEFDEMNANEFLSKTYFKAQSIQALMVKKELITQNNLEMVLGAVGQDTLYFHELLAQAGSVKLMDEVIHIYYANVEGSAVNKITKSTFDKYLIMEKARIRFLQNENLMDTYMDFRFNYYFNNWYFKKLKMVKESDYSYAVNILNDIYNMYHELYPEKIESEITQQMKQMENAVTG
ncbi:MAG TPA: glycosyltransferase, partial [Bacillota bacterium]|nr:glycosyltransferase [Bacillota bacterium]